MRDSVGSARRLSPTPQASAGSREEQGSEKKQDGRNRDGGEHPAPTVLAVPGETDHFRGRTILNFLGNQPIHELRSQDTHDDGQLVQSD